MRRKWAAAGFLGLLIFAVSLSPAFGGDSLYGKVTAVKSPEVVVLEVGGRQHDVRIVGIDAPQEERLASEAKQFVSSLVLGKNVRMRFERRAANGEMVAR